LNYLENTKYLDFFKYLFLNQRQVIKQTTLKYAKNVVAL